MCMYICFTSLFLALCVSVTIYIFLLFYIFCKHHRNNYITYIYLDYFFIYLVTVFSAFILLQSVSTHRLSRSRFRGERERENESKEVFVCHICLSVSVYKSISIGFASVLHKIHKFVCLFSHYYFCCPSFCDFVQNEN